MNLNSRNRQMKKKRVRDGHQRVDSLSFLCLPTFFYELAMSLRRISNYYH